MRGGPTLRHMNAEQLEHLAELVRCDRTVASYDYSAVTFIVRSGQGWMNAFGFRYDAAGTAHYLCLEDPEAFRLVRRLRREAREDWRVLTVTVHADRAAAELQTFRGADADPWFVDLGNEDDVAGLARPFGLPDGGTAGWAPHLS